MKRLLVALTVAALLAILTIPALASQSKPLDPSLHDTNTITSPTIKR